MLISWKLYFWLWPSYVFINSYLWFRQKPIQSEVNNKDACADLCSLQDADPTHFEAFVCIPVGKMGGAWKNWRWLDLASLPSDDIEFCLLRNIQTVEHQDSTKKGWNFLSKAITESRCFYLYSSGIFYLYEQWLFQGCLMGGEGGRGVNFGLN